MGQDNSTKLVIGVVILLAIIGVVFLLRSGGYVYKSASSESPGQYGWSGECCTCTRAQLTKLGSVMPATREVLFRNEHVADCTSACAEQHKYTRNPRVNYDVNAFVSNDAECRTSLPQPLAYSGAGGFNDQPTSDSYYVAS